MKHQAMKAFTTLSGMLTLMIISAFASTTASAQTLDTNIVVDVPFNFTVANETFQAGTVTIRRMSTSNSAVVVSSADHRQNEIRLTGDKYVGNSSNLAKLVFNKYGKQYFLAQIWTPGESTVRELSKSHAESSLARELRIASRTRTTKNNVNFETVSVLAKLQ